MKSLPSKSHTKLPVEVQRALKTIKKIVTGFDRLTLWLNHPAPDIPASLIRRHCGGLEILDCRSLPFQATWQTKIDIFQPSIDALLALENMIGMRQRVRLRYAELALDWLVDDRATAAILHRFVLKHLRVPYMRDSVVFKEDTTYFARRALTDGGKKARNVVLYADWPSKLSVARQQNSSCCHLEYRLQSVDTLAAHGLLTLADCTRFDHRAFWMERLRLFRLPSKVELGRWLAPENTDVSGTALAKRADRFLDRYSRDGAFVLQDCWRENPDIKYVLTPLASALFLDL